ncbi:Set1 complex component ash2 [Rhodotorula toruloides ATCC 204091]|uniref:Set1 complex component ash2 n=1 Tax=Rhodotorula toruloides TaxID=5286 RepID=A0A0K3CMG4_RHOTO|nr:Set1 complex component ash2 [Rhodotorula toruloides ATCC 204091]KAK4335332.1 COMPASS component BRE2 [Rhodotorula toruloides]PRQ71421.1 Set1 complex component ash2 [Rhodotorula toruloides]
MYSGGIDPALLANGDPLAPTPALIEDREPSPGADTPERDESEEQRRRPTKRKHSPSPATPLSHSPAPALADPSDVSNPPVLVPHNLQIPDSAFEFFATRSHPFNKFGFRYTPCGPSPHTLLPVPPQRSIESYPQGIRWSWEDRSLFTLLTEDAKTLTTDKGWRAARSNIGVREGAWYWEVRIDRGGGEGGRDHGGEGQGSWVRVGVGRRESPLNAPVGIDGYSYGYRDKSGDSVTLAQPTPYGKPYGSSTVIGIYLALPPRPAYNRSDKRSPARVVRKRIPIRYKGQLYFEQLEYAPSKEMEELLVDPALKAFKQRQKEEKEARAKSAAPGTRAPPANLDEGPPLRPLPKLEGSKVAFFVDGECQGVAFEDLYDFLPLRKNKGGKEKKKDARSMMENWHDDGALGYFPMASVFGGGIATINSGPDFAFPPPDDIEAVLASSPHPPRSPYTYKPPRLDNGKTWRPLCDRYDEYNAEQARLDDLDEQDAVRVLLAAQKAAAEQAALAGPLTAGEAGKTASDMDGSSTPASKKARTTLAQAAVVASSKLAMLGAVKESLAVGQGESPGQSPSPLPGEAAVKMETEGHEA